MFGEDVELFYADGELVTPEAGEPFRGFLTIRDAKVFDAPLVGDCQLQFPATRSLSKSQLINVDGVQYRVAEQPMRIGVGNDLVVGLFRERV
ncbi:hypothetical protein [Thauera propionica]|uniref:hypothetical protein n=1 Tax=Thauera propionica TaxID=2019431 RepID=UPI0023F2894D|nr:hypothetical protein [Thauera propionica]MDD3674990.1 hypothetical protein [Thauera propionica]